MDDWFDFALHQTLCWLAAPVGQQHLLFDDDEIGGNDVLSDAQQCREIVIVVDATHTRRQRLTAASHSAAASIIANFAPDEPGMSSAITLSPALQRLLVRRACCHSDAAACAVCREAAVSGTSAPEVPARELDDSSWMLAPLHNDACACPAEPLVAVVLSAAHTGELAPAQARPVSRLLDAHAVALRRALAWAAGEDKDGFREEFGVHVLLPLVHAELCCRLRGASPWVPVAEVAAALSSRCASTLRLSATFVDLGAAEHVENWLVQLISLRDDDAGGATLLQLKRGEPAEHASAWLVRPSSAWASSPVPPQRQMLAGAAAFTAARLHFVLRDGDIIRAASVMQHALLLQAMKGEALLLRQPLLVAAFDFVFELAASTLLARTGVSVTAPMLRRHVDQLAAAQLAALPGHRATPGALDGETLPATPSGATVLARSTARNKRQADSDGIAAAAIAPTRRLEAAVASRILARAGAPCHACAAFHASGACPIPGLTMWLLPAGIVGHKPRMALEAEQEQQLRRRPAARGDRPTDRVVDASAKTFAPTAAPVAAIPPQKAKDAQRRQRPLEDERSGGDAIPEAVKEEPTKELAAEISFAHLKRPIASTLYRVLRAAAHQSARQRALAPQLATVDAMLRALLLEAEDRQLQLFAFKIPQHAREVLAAAERSACVQEQCGAESVTHDGAQQLLAAALRQIAEDDERQQNNAIALCLVTNERLH